MAEYRGLDSFDYIFFVVKWKKLLISLALFIGVITYVLIYFFIPAQYDSTALIIPSKESQSFGISSLLKNFSDLPFNIGGLASNSNVDMYNTVIYSRTNLEKIIDKFDLYKEYGLNSMEKTIDALKNNITTDVNEEGAYTIKVRASSPEKSAEMNNYLISLLNKSIIELNISKARDNREFIEKRYNEVNNNLTLAEDSLKIFQEKTGMFEAEDQVKAIIEGYANLESDLAKKQIELAVVEKMTGSSSPQTRQSQAVVNEFQNKLKSLKNGTSSDQFIFSLKSLPQNAIQYFRYFRDVKIYGSVLEYLIPLYEQAKFDEHKEVPILQVIDYAVPPEKKAYPKRLLLTAVITFFILLIVVILLIIKETLNRTENPKIKLILSELKFRKKKS